MNPMASGLHPSPSPFLPRAPHTRLSTGPFAIRLPGCACSAFPPSRQPWSAGNSCAPKQGSPNTPTLLRRRPDTGHSSGVKHHQGLERSNVSQTGPRSTRKQPRVTRGIWIPPGRIGVTPKMTISRGWELTAPRCPPLPHPRQGQGPCRRDTPALGVSAGTKHCVRLRLHCP